MDMEDLLIRDRGKNVTEFSHEEIRKPARDPSFRNQPAHRSKAHRARNLSRKCLPLEDLACGDVPLVKRVTSIVAGKRTSWSCARKI
jgi:hypothetical protein